MIFRLVLLNFFCLVCSLYGDGFDITHRGRFLVVDNGFIKVSFDKKHNFVITNVAYKGKSFFKSLQVVADVENGKEKNCLERYAQRKRANFKEDEDKFIVTVCWRSRYFDVGKTITVFKFQPVVVVHYDFYIIDKPPLRVLAAPLIDFASWIKDVSYQDRTGEVHSCRVCDIGSRPFGKFSCRKPGLWYAAGDSDSGMVVVVPKLVSEYGNFTWPVEFGQSRQLVRNYDVGKVGMFFPHKLANGSPDTKFSATVVLSVYQDGDIQSAVDSISKLVKIEKPVFKSAPANTSAQYQGDFDGVNLWCDYQSGVHRRSEKLKRQQTVKPFKLHSAKNQYVSFQVIANSRVSAKLKDVRLEGLPADVEVRLCRYIKLPEPSRIFPSRDVKDYPSYWPDPLVKFEPIVINKDENQGIWVTLYVSPDVRAGDYAGRVILDFGDKSVDIKVALRVFDFTLPTPRTFKNITDVYGEMIAKGRGQRSRKYVNAYSGGIENRYADLFTRYNLSVIGYYERAFETDAIRDYWKRCSAVSLPGSEAMIVFEGRYWPKYVGGKKYQKGDEQYFHAAVEVFRKRIDYYRSVGITGDIYAVITDDALYREDFRRFLLKFVRAVRKLDDQLVIVGCVKSNFDDKFSKLFDVVIAGVDLSSDVEGGIKRAIGEGKISARWTVLNQWTAIDADPVELRSIFWKLFSRGITGSWNWDGLWFWFLTDDVYNRPKLNNWWGEGYLVYPPGDGPVPSIRLAQMRAGIDDYEYLVILRRLGGKDLLREIANFSDISTVELEGYRVKIGETIEDLRGE